MDVPNWLLQQLIQLGDDDADSDPDDPEERQDGEASQAELQRLDAADWKDLKPAYAAACARACVVARELPVALPPELIAAIAGNSAEAPAERFCTCGLRRREEVHRARALLVGGDRGQPAGRPSEDLLHHRRVE